jgi:hypothetical protein
MKLNKSISELVKTNYVPVEEAKEGLLRGGFGEISTGGGFSTGSYDECTNTNCPCPPPETTTTTPKPTTTPSPGPIIIIIKP